VSFTHFPVVEIILIGSFALLLVTVFLLGRLSTSGASRRTAQPQAPADPQSAASPLRRLEHDLSVMVDFMNEYTVLMSDLNEQTEVRGIPAVLLNAMVRMFRAEQAAVLVPRRGTFVDPKRVDRMIVAAAATSERGLDVGTEVPIGDGQLGLVAETRRVMDRADFNQMAASNQARFRSSHIPIFEVAAPMVHGDDTLGVIAFSRPQRHHPHEKEMLQMIAKLGAITWHNLTAYRNVQVAADVDELTRIFNKRALKTQLSELVLRARSSGGRVGLFLFDIDHFKNYNDQNGHIAGDEALRLLARIVKDSVRADDIFGRFGGEEFLLIMPGRTPAQAMSAAGNIRQRIEMYDFPFGEKQPLRRVTVSGGVATFPDDARDAVELLLAADDALYRAKGAGRNKVLRAETGLNPMPVPHSIQLNDDDDEASHA